VTYPFFARIGFDAATLAALGAKFEDLVAGLYQAGRDLALAKFP
jgi:hypothetical protein